MTRIVRFRRTTVETADVEVPSGVDPERWRLAGTNWDTVVDALNDADTPEVTFEVIDEWEEEDEA